MRYYRDRDACGRADEVTVIEDPSQVVQGPDGHWRPSYTYIDPNTIRAHPVFIAVLLHHAEPLWTQEQVLATLAGA